MLQKWWVMALRNVDEQGKNKDMDTQLTALRLIANSWPEWIRWICTGANWQPRQNEVNTPCLTVISCGDSRWEIRF